MATVNFKGNPVNLAGELPQTNQTAPNFTFVKDDLSEATLYDFDNKIKVILAVPSLDTGVCQTETKRFNEQLAGRSDVQGLVISKDLPFAMGRFCESENIDNVMSGSDFRYSEFGKNYQTDMADGPLKGLSCRAVFVVDQDNVIQYLELVPEITQEPDYERAMEAIEKLEA